MENEISKTIALVESKADYINLISSNFAPYRPKSINAILEKKAQDYFAKTSYEPDSKGLLSARQAIANYYKSRGSEVDIDRLFITASSSESYSLIFNTSDIKDGEALLPNPGYPLFDYLTSFSKLKPVYYKLNEADAWQPDIKDITSKINAKTKFIVLIDPNNPTGSLIYKNSYEKIIKLAENNNIAIIIDEVFYEFTHSKQAEIINFNKINTPVFVLNGISKTLALPDMKLAWFACNNEVSETTLEQLEIANDCFLNANYFTQSALNELLTEKETVSKSINEILSKNAGFLKELTRNGVINCNLPLAGIHAMIELNIDLDEESLVLALLNQKHVNSHPGYFYDYEVAKPHLVISLLQNPENFAKGLSRIQDFGIEYRRLQ